MKLQSIAPATTMSALVAPPSVAGERTQVVTGARDANRARAAVQLGTPARGQSAGARGGRQVGASVSRSGILDRIRWSAERAHAGRPPALLWIPALLVTCAMLLPLAYLLLRTAQAGTGAVELLWRPRTLELLLRSTGLALTVTIAATLVGLSLAWLTVRTDLPGRRLWSTLVILPLVIPSYVGAFTFVAAFGPRGLLQQALDILLGVERLPEIYGFYGAAVALSCFTYPYVVLSVRGTLQGMDPALEEAARSLGYGRWRTFWSVTFPQLRPALAAGSLLVALYTLGDFGVVSLLQYDSFPRAIYVQYQASFDRTLAAALALLLVGVTAVALGLEAWSRGRARYYRRACGPSRGSRLVALGRWRWPALAFVGSVVAFALVVPLVVLAYWLGRGMLAGQASIPIWQAMLNSVYASGLAAVVASAAALPVAILAVRYPSFLGALVERLAYIGYALPGIVIALALVFFGANYVTPLYQTLSLLVFAYVIRFLPQAVGATRSSLLQVSPGLEEAARGLGRTWPRTVWEVTIPLIRPGVLAGAVLVFLTAMKELPATLLLSPIGFKTLATISYRNAGEGHFAEAAAPALLLVLVSGAALLVALCDRGGSPERRD